MDKKSEHPNQGNTVDQLLSANQLEKEKNKTGLPLKDSVDDLSKDPSIKIKNPSIKKKN